jgi:hypothetical protein
MHRSKKKVPAHRTRPRAVGCGGPVNGGLRASPNRCCDRKCAFPSESSGLRGCDVPASPHREPQPRRPRRGLGQSVVTRAGERPGVSCPLVLLPRGPGALASAPRLRRGPVLASDAADVVRCSGPAYGGEEGRQEKEEQKQKGEQKEEEGAQFDNPSIPSSLLQK